MKITRENYKNYEYIQYKPIEEHTDEELKARKFYITDIYKGVKGPMYSLKKMELNKIKGEKLRRGI